MRFLQYVLAALVARLVWNLGKAGIFFAVGVVIFFARLAKAAWQAGNARAT